MYAYSNLLVKNNTGDSANKIDMTAELIALDDGSGNTIQVPMTTTITIDKSSTSQTSTEVFKRDQADLFPVSKWIFIWAIYNSVTNSIAGLFSLSANAPTLPSGYTHRALVGAVRNGDSGNFVAFSQIGNKVVIARILLISGTETTFYNLNSGLSPIVPATAKKLIGDMQANQDYGTLSAVYAAIASDSSGLGQLETYFQGASASDLWISRTPYSIALTIPQSVWYKTITNGGAQICVLGWEY